VLNVKILKSGRVIGLRYFRNRADHVALLRQLQQHIPQHPVETTIGVRSGLPIFLRLYELFIPPQEELDRINPGQS